MNQNVRKITDGAMMVAIIGIVLLINRQFAGLLVAYVLFLIPLPMVFFGAKYGYNNGLVPLAAIAILSFLLGTGTTMFYVISESIIGLIYGGGIKKEINSNILLIITIVGAVIVNVISSYILASFFGYNLAEQMQNIQRECDEYGLTNFLGVPLTQLLTLLYLIENSILGVMEGFLTSVISRFMLIRLKFDIAKPRPITSLNPPKWTGYVALASFLCALCEIRVGLGNEVVQNVIISIGIICGIYLAAFGCIFLMVLLKLQLNASAGISVIVIMFCILILSVVMAFVGFLYISTNIRTALLKEGQS